MCYTFQRLRPGLCQQKGKGGLNTATRCNVLQHATIFCNTLATQYRTLQHACNTLQHTATYCNELLNIGTQGSTRLHNASGNTLQYMAVHSNTRQHTATHGTTRQHTATHSNTRQHTATHGNTRQHSATHLIEATDVSKCAINVCRVHGLLSYHIFVVVCLDVLAP